MAALSAKHERDVFKSYCTHLSRYSNNGNLSRLKIFLSKKVTSEIVDLYLYLNWQNVLGTHHASAHGGSSDLIVKMLD